MEDASVKRVSSGMCASKAGRLPGRIDLLAAIQTVGPPLEHTRGLGLVEDDGQQCWATIRSGLKYKAWRNRSTWMAELTATPPTHGMSVSHSDRQASRYVTPPLL